MAISDKLIKVVKSKGWAAIASLYFDNALGVEVYNSRGYVTINPDEGLVYAKSIIDITDTTKMEGQVVIMPEKRTFNQQTIAVYDMECLQSFELAHYSHWDYITDENSIMPMPKVPTKDEIMAYTLSADDPIGKLYDENGRYKQFRRFDNADTAELRKPSVLTYTNLPKEDVTLTPEYESVISLYDDDVKRASLVIGWWQMFFKNQEKFMEAIKAEYGDTTLI